MDGYYCYAFDFLEVQFFKETEAITNPPVPAPIPDISLQMSCKHVRSGVTYDCSSTSFTRLPFDSCIIPLTYTYTINNTSNDKVRLISLVDESLIPLIREHMTIGPNKAVVVEDSQDVNICSNPTLKKGLAIAIPEASCSTSAEARDDLTINFP